MIKPPLIAAGLVAAMIGFGGTANAGPVNAPTMALAPGIEVQTVHHTSRGYRHVLPRRAVVRSLYRRGYRDVHRVHFHRGYWRARAYGRRGLIALTIHPRSGEILHRKVVHHHRYHPKPRRHHRGGVTFSFGFH